MTTKVHHITLFAITSLFVAACGDDGPCLDAGDDGECIGGEAGETGGTGGPPQIPECAPFKDAQFGNSFTCQGDGTGWLVADIYGAGNANPITTCLAYETQEIPDNPTSNDCAAIPFDLIPYDIPAPTACCTDEAEMDDITNACMEDCGFAACKTTVAAIRAAAATLVAPDGLPQAPFDTSKADLYAYANVLDAPGGLKFCANKVRSSPGEIVSLGLGSGASKPATLGHINSATLYLSCGLDRDEPYAVDPEALQCTEPANTPVAIAQLESQGVLTSGRVELTGPGVDTFVPITNTRVTTREVLDHDMSVEFTLTSFDLAVLDASVGVFELRDIQVHLVAPASGLLHADTVTFAPGTLRFAVAATLLVDGERLLAGPPITAEYANEATATAIRGHDGGFHFVQATFSSGEYTAVLHTDPSVLYPVQ